MLVPFSSFLLSWPPLLSLFRSFFVSSFFKSSIFDEFLLKLDAISINLLSPNRGYSDSQNCSNKTSIDSFSFSLLLSLSSLLISILLFTAANFIIVPSDNFLYENTGGGGIFFWRGRERGGATKLISTNA